MNTLLNPNSIHVEGWLRRQLEVQLAGLSGHLDTVWPDVRDSAWVGGNREGWERMPYWLDGFIPLVYLLRDEEGMARADGYIEAILSHQEADGWICPGAPADRKHYDVWAVFLIGKVLAEYCRFTDSQRARDGLYRAMKSLYRELKNATIRLFQWGKFRWFEAYIPLRYLLAHYDEAWIVELARMLRDQGVDYHTYEQEWKQPSSKWALQTHIVNLNMMLKQEVLTCNLLGEPYTHMADHFWEVLEAYNGTAVGTFTGDECLSGRANNQGTELCSVVELMYSLEWLYAGTGEGVWADRLEKVAFNALPATLTDDMWAHQYDQQVNQIACRDLGEHSIFRTNTGEAHLFGLEPHFGCCTANFSQGWPKLAQNAFLRTDDGILCVMMLPATLSTEIDGVAVTVRMETDYPFRHTCRYTVETAAPVNFALHIRIPGWAKTATVNGQAVPAGHVHIVSRTWDGKATVELAVSDVPHTVSRPGKLLAVEYGPLVFSLPLAADYTRKEYVKSGVERKFPYCDYELSSTTPWSYGLAATEFTVRQQPVADVPFASTAPAVTVSAKLAPIDWGYAEGQTTVAAAIPRSRVATGDAREQTLIPYGCAKLRMTELPLIEK